MQQSDPNKQLGPLQTQTEKPLHYAYLKEFRVEQCQQFLQHKCNQHKPYTCFHWHFNNQRRRRPIRRRDGTFNYSPEIYCPQYDESTGICPDGDECPFLHRVAGDVERRYHLRYFKTCMCVHDTDARGQCMKNGAHCAFAHGQPDLRPPVFDINELQAIEKGEYPNGIAGYCGPNILDKERSMMNDDPKWQDAGYVLANYKTEICKKPPRLCRQGYACPQYHNNKDKRRSPRKHKYRSTPCPQVKGGDEWGDPTQCEAGDSCQYCHTRTEQQFHPEIYKSSRCHDMQANGLCPRGPFCAFAHLDHEISLARDLQAQCESGIPLGDLLSTALSSSAKDADMLGPQRQVSEQEAKKSQPLEVNMNGGPSNGYLSSSLPNREPVGMSSGLFGKGIAPGAIGGQHQAQQQVIPPSIVPRSNSIGHRALPSVAPTSSMKTGASDSSPIISLPTNFSDTMVLQSGPLRNSVDNDSGLINRLNGLQVTGSPDALYKDVAAPLPSYSKAPGSEKEATRRRQLSAKEGFIPGETSGDHGLNFSGLLSRGFAGSPFSQGASSQLFQSSDVPAGQIEDQHIDDPFFGVTNHPLDFDDAPRQNNLNLPFGSRGSAPVSIPTSTGVAPNISNSGIPQLSRWGSESPTSNSLSSVLNIGNSLGGATQFNLAVGSPSVPPGFPRQNSLHQHQNLNQMVVGGQRTRAESGAMNDALSLPGSLKFGSLPASISGPTGSNAPLSPEMELVKLREELISNRAKMASWEEGIAQARQACEAWKQEAESANGRAAKEKQMKEEAQEKLYLLQREVENNFQNFGSQNNNNNLLNLLTSLNQLPVQELRGVQAQLFKELERVTKLIQESESKPKQ